MPKYLFITFSFLMIACSSYAQKFIEPVIGFQVDPNNSGKFKLLNTGIQLAFKESRRYEMVIRMQKCWGLNYHSSDSSFTTNQALPLYAPANKTILPGEWYLSLDHRFILKSRNTNHQFYILLLTGLTFQNLQVTYQYDKNDYTILNPDKTLKGSGLLIGTGFEYMRSFKNNRLFFRLTADALQIGGKIKYPSSFTYMSPVAFNAGYSVLIKKKKHAK